MNDADAQLLNAVRTWRPPEELHPMAILASALYHAAGGELTAEVNSMLKDALDEYGKDLIDLAMAMEGLVRFKIILEQKYDDEDGARQLVELMRSYMPLYEPFWRRVGEALRRANAHQQSTFLAFLDADNAPKAKAAKFGEAPPQGAMPARVLVTPGRPPPHRRRNRRR